jgi:proteasome accessory factor B
MPSFPRHLLVRLARIDGELRAKHWPNAATLAKLLEVNERTVHRDIDCLRDQLGAPIEYDPSRHGYYYREETYRLSLPQITEGECLALFLGERLLQQYKGMPIADDLQRLFEKITVLLPNSVSLSPEHLAQAYSVRTQPVDPGDPDHFRMLMRAVRDGRQLELLYWSAWRDETNRRVVDPYHLTVIDGDWLLVAYCHLREEIRVFAPGRIREMRETGQHFDRPADFRITDFLDLGFRKVRGTGPVQEVRLRFSPVAARYVRERAWHPTQKIQECRDGGLVLTLRVNHLAEIKRWVLSWGAECEVEGPGELRENLAAELKSIIQKQNA